MAKRELRDTATGKDAQTKVDSLADRLRTDAELRQAAKQEPDELRQAKAKTMCLRLVAKMRRSCKQPTQAAASDL